MIGTTLMILVIVSCQLEAPDPGKLQATADGAAVPPAPIAGSSKTGLVGWFDIAEPIYAKAVAAAVPAVANPPLVFEAYAGDCRAPHGELRLRFKLHSAFAIHDIKASLTADKSGEFVDVDVEGAHVRFATETGDKAAIRSLVCTATAENPSAPQFTASAKLMETVQNWARFTAPDCDVALAKEPGGGLDCRLPQADPELARQELVGVRTAMIRGWSRQPYLLTRRVAIGIEMADALLADDANKRLDTVCKILKASLPHEMPATLASRRWQSIACTPDAAQRRTAALFGLQKTVAEIDFLRQVFERTAKLGMLNVHVQVPAGAGDTFLVNLTPQADVVDNLTRTTATLLATDGSSNTQGGATKEAPRTCWHPLYSEDTNLLRLARHLAMAGEVTNVACETTGDDKLVNRYFAESIASETEFVLQNGRSKTLRLPVGKYSYTIKALPDSAEDWDDSAQSAPESKGQITWDDKRPRAAIASW